MVSSDTMTAEVPRLVETTEAFEAWFSDQDAFVQRLIESTIQVAIQNGVITSSKSLGDGLFEKKWKNGLRLYFAVVEVDHEMTLILLGSGKGRDQERAITKTRLILSSLGNILKTVNRKE